MALGMIIFPSSFKTCIKHSMCVHVFIQIHTFRTTLKTNESFWKACIQSMLSWKSWNQEILELDVGLNGEGVVQDDSQFTAIGKWVSLSSVQFSHSVMSDSLQLHGLQHTRLPCPSPTPRVYSNSCPLSWWWHPTILSSVVPFSSCLSQHQGLFKWVSSSHQVAKVLEFQLQHQSFQWIFRTDFL